MGPQSQAAFLRARTGTDRNFLTPAWISFSLSSWWPVIVSFSSLELVGELFAMPVDPDGSSEEASQKSSSCPKGTGDGPNLDIRARK